MVGWSINQLVVGYEVEDEGIPMCAPWEGSL